MTANTPASALVTAQGPQTGQVLLLLFYLALIIAGAYFFTRLIARLAQRGGIYGAAPVRAVRSIKLIDRLQLDREHSVLLIESDGQRYLVGMGSGSFTLLDKSDAPEQEEPQAEPQRPSFKDALAALNWKKQGEDKDAP